jgi:hypothetical protein
MTRRLIAGAVLFIGTIVIGLILDRINKNDRQATGYAFPDLQNASSVEQAKAVLETWHTKNADAGIKKAMYIDLVFPFFYAGLIALICFQASAHMRTRWVAVAGLIMAAVALLGGIFDILENTRMLSMVGHPENAREIATVAKFRTLKIWLVVVPMVYALLAHFDAGEG